MASDNDTPDFDPIKQMQIERFDGATWNLMRRRDDVNEDSDEAGQAFQYEVGHPVTI